MTTKELLQKTAHRPWNIPNQNWLWYQEWNNAIFLHWEVDPQILQEYVPKGLTLDLFNEKAWVSMVAFTMEKIRPRYFPPFPPISNFHEINLRTYLKKDGKAGVYFLNIEGGKALSCRIAKSVSGLPYRYAPMKRTSNGFLSKNRQTSDIFELKFEIGEPLQKDALDLWLTERYCLYQDFNTDIIRYEIHHGEWPVQQLILKESNIKYPRFSKFINNTPQKVHYSKGVPVLAWKKEKI